MRFELELVKNIIKTGGFTAFPNIGVAARPKRGSVVFWYSLDTEGARYKY